MDGLHVVALLGGQGGVEQQFGHAQYAIHRRADLVADLGEEFRLGPHLGHARRAPAAGVELVALHLPVAFGGGLAEQETDAGGDAEQAADQPFAAGRYVTEQRRQAEGPDADEDGHADHEQARRLVAMRPVVDRDQQHAQARHHDQAIEQGAGGHRQEVVQRHAEDHRAENATDQQAPQRQGRGGMAEEGGGVADAAEHRQRQRQLCGQRLPALLRTEQWAEEAEQHGAGQQQEGMHASQPEPAAQAGVGEADEVVEQQHGQAAEQRAEQQGTQLVVRLQAAFQVDAGIQRMAGFQAQVQVERLGAGGQRQEHVAVQPGADVGRVVAGAPVFEQLLAL
ncbi:hypothetical protein D3C78_991300 [compost metagenome]